MLGYESPSVLMLVRKVYKTLRVISFHLKSDLIKFIQHFEPLIKSIKILGFPKKRENFLLINHYEIVLWLNGDRIYIEDMELPIALILRNLQKTLDESCYFGKLSYEVVKSSEKAQTMIYQLKQKGDYEWVEN